MKRPRKYIRPREPDKFLYWLHKRWHTGRVRLIVISANKHDAGRLKDTR